MRRVCRPGVRALSRGKRFAPSTMWAKGRTSLTRACSRNLSVYSSYCMGVGRGGEYLLSRRKLERANCRLRTAFEERCGQIGRPRSLRNELEAAHAASVSREADGQPLLREGGREAVGPLDGRGRPIE